MKRREWVVEIVVRAPNGKIERRAVFERASLADVEDARAALRRIEDRLLGRVMRGINRALGSRRLPWSL